jgi:hypothetical protein
VVCDRERGSPSPSTVGSCKPLGQVPSVHDPPPVNGLASAIVNGSSYDGDTERRPDPGLAQIRAGGRPGPTSSALSPTRATGCLSKTARHFAGCRSEQGHARTCLPRQSRSGQRRDDPDLLRNVHAVNHSGTLSITPATDCVTDHLSAPSGAMTRHHPPGITTLRPLDITRPYHRRLWT